MGYIRQSKSLLLMAEALKDVSWIRKYDLRATCPVCGYNGRYKRESMWMSVRQTDIRDADSPIMAYCKKCKAGTRRIVCAIGLQGQVKYEDTGEEEKPNMESRAKPIDLNLGETVCTTCIHYNRSMGFEGCELRNEYCKGAYYVGPNNCKDYRLDRETVEAALEAMRRNIEHMESKLNAIRARMQLLERVTGRETSKTDSADGFAGGPEHD